ncbi:hypothetical protein GDO86_009177 [Hymenochirus boettgeri]|uniref:ESF1 homolog n=1 Tax=Hymenochirus boettgeri TaxID=247094 RepID=A0A8T2JKM9_9PIPI|nr:hypothetical protein GDO86_009177 [Hymenochirus boettgeri]
MASKTNLTSDQRFNRVTKDPRFWEMPDKDKKIKIDKRFRAMFHDKKFNLKYTVDKRGRPISHNTTEDLMRFYDLSDSDELSDDESPSGSSLVEQKAKIKKEKDSGGNAQKATEKKQKNVKPTSKEEKNKNNRDQKLKGQNKRTIKEISNINAGLIENKLSKDNKETLRHSTKIGESQESEESGVDDESDGESESESHSGSEDSDVQNTESEESQESESSEENLEEQELNDEEISGKDEDSDSGPDLARGKGNIETSSEDEDEDDILEELSKEPEIEHDWREMDKEAPRGDQITNRLAVCNMDWDRLKAKDLLALFNSFKPKGGIVLSVKIYPSEFGKERMKQEEFHGPLELKNIAEENEKEQGVYKEKLREYQFKRLKYFYAVVECDTPETANKIYEECDGLEFESSCSFVDLRFIPDDEQFTDEPKDAAVDIDLSAYKPKLFVSPAMVTSKTTRSNQFNGGDMESRYILYIMSKLAAEKVKGLKENAEQMVKNKLEGKDQLTPWEKYLQKQKDKRKIKRKKTNSQDKLKEEEGEGEEEVDEIPSDVDLNDPYFSEELKKTGLKKTTTSGKKEREESSSEDEANEEKEKAQIALLMMDDDEEDRKHFNYDKIVEQQNLSKRKKKQLQKKQELLEDEFQINVEDTRFQAMYTSHLYNIDPSDPNFKKTKAMNRVLEEKAKRREVEQTRQTEAVKRREVELENLQKKGPSTSRASDPALSLLLKSVKNKTQQFQASKKQKTK